MDDPLLQLGDPSNPYNQAEPFVDCECPITGHHFAWYTVTVPPDQIIICQSCGKNHIIGEVGDMMEYDPDNGWYVNEGWRINHMDKSGPDNRDDRLKANDRQPGGTHYKDAGEIQHWDIISHHNVGYLEGCATKYLCRWRKKAGMLDLEKAAHYTDKLIEIVAVGQREPGGKVPHEVLVRFSAAYDLWSTDETACCFLLTWTDLYQLKMAREAIDRTIARAKKEGWPAEGGQKPPAFLAPDTKK